MVTPPVVRVCTNLLIRLPLMKPFQPQELALLGV